MSYDPGWLLLSRIIQYEALKDVQGRNIETKMFATKMQKRVFTFLAAHYAKYRKVASSELLARKFPRAKIGLVAQEPTEYYIDQFLTQYLRVHGADIMKEAASGIRDDPLGVFEELRAQATSLLGRATKSEDYSLNLTHAERYRDYRAREKGGMLGIPTPYETWTEISLGWQPEDFILITARPGVGKTFFLLWNALHAAYVEMQEVLFFSKEMSIKAMQRRSDAMWYGLPWRDFRKATMSPADKTRFKEGLKEHRRLVKQNRMGNLTFIGDARMTTATIDAKIDQVNPDIVFIDGLYLLRDEANTPDKYVRIANVSTETKAVAQAHKIPVLGTSQIHRVQGNLEKNWQAITLGDLAFSDALAQDTDLVWCLIRTPQMRENKTMFAKCLKMREDEAKDFGIAWDLATMQDTFGEIELEDGQLPQGEMDDDDVDDWDQNADDGDYEEDDEEAIQYDDDDYEEED